MLTHSRVYIYHCRMRYDYCNQICEKFPLGALKGLLFYIINRKIEVLPPLETVIDENSVALVRIVDKDNGSNGWKLVANL